MNTFGIWNLIENQINIILYETDPTRQNNRMIEEKPPNRTHPAMEERSSSRTAQTLISSLLL